MFRLNGMPGLFYFTVVFNAPCSIVILSILIGSVLNLFL